MSLPGSLLERLRITCGPITTSGGCCSRLFVKACGCMERVLIPNNYTVWSVLALLTCFSSLPCHQQELYAEITCLQWELSSSGRGQRAGRDCCHGIVLFEDTINPITLKEVFKWKVTFEKKKEKLYKGVESEDDWRAPVGAAESGVSEWTHFLLLPEVS